MVTLAGDEFELLVMCAEWFLYGIYSGIFAIYFKLHRVLVSKESRTTSTVFYALCLLYVLSTASVACDLLDFVIQMHIDALPVQLQSDSRSMLLRVSIAQATLFGCCDFIAQCTLIYRCWIVWGKNIRVVIVPTFLAITYIAIWLASDGALIIDDEELTSPWGNTLALSGLLASMAVNALVTGLIVFKILKVLSEVKPTSVERTLGSFNSAGGPKLRHVIFIIIESGMALFAIQMFRVVLSSIVESLRGPMPRSLRITLDIVIIIQQALNGIAPIIILIRVQMGLSYDDEESLKESVGSLHFINPPSNPDSLQGVGISSSIPPEEGNEDNPNIILEVPRVAEGSNSGTGQERSEDT